MNIHGGIFVMAKKLKQLKCPSMDKWMNETCYIHIEEYYLAIKRNEVQIYPTTH